MIAERGHGWSHEIGAGTGHLAEGLQQVGWRFGSDRVASGINVAGIEGVAEKRERQGSVRRIRRRAAKCGSKSTAVASEGEVAGGRAEVRSGGVRGSRGMAPGCGSLGGGVRHQSERGNESEESHGQLAWADGGSWKTTPWSSFCFWVAGRSRSARAILRGWPGVRS